MKDSNNVSIKNSPQLAEVVKVIHIEFNRGDGSEQNPVRKVDQYWSFNGYLLAERDPIEEVR